MIRGAPVPVVLGCLLCAVVLVAGSVWTSTGALVRVAVEQGSGSGALVHLLVRSLARAAVFAAAAAVLTWRARTVRTEAQVWGWFARAARVATAAAVAAGVVDCSAAVGVLPESGLGGLVLGVGVLVACPLLYQGLVRWNRYGTVLSDPGDWLNGVGAVFALTAVGNLVLPLIGSPLVRWPLWSEQLWLLRASAEVMLLGSAVTVLVIGGLARDVRAWALSGSLLLVVVVDLAAVHDPVAAAGNGRWSEVGWAVMALSLAVAAVVRAAPPLARPVTTTAPTAGSLVVLLASIAVLVAAGLSTHVLGDGEVQAAAVSGGLAALSVSVRGVQLISMLSDLVMRRREALTDDLTGLSNRRALNQRLRAGYDRGEEVTLVILDLDSFKQVNDRFGHAVGDELLRRAGVLLRSVAGPEAFVARLGGDEFALVLPGGSVDAAEQVLGALQQVTLSPVRIEGRHLRVSGSAGIARSRDARDPEQLLVHADAAMYRAKAAGGGLRVHDEAAAAAAAEQALLVEELRALLGEQDAVPGLQPGDLEVHYQPQVDRGGRLVGVEALVRWRNARRGLLGPDTFLPLVEDYGLMPAMTTRVLWQSTTQVAAWRRRGLDLRVSVNLSAACLTHPDLLGTVEDTLTATGLPAGRLVLEVTETSVMADPAGSVARLGELVARGVEVSIDDYGTGHSSLAYLNDLPAVELKLDRSLVAGVGSGGRAEDIVAGTVALAHRLGLRIVAEGVEDAQVLHALHRLGCDETQGYFHSRPLPAAAFEQWLGALPATRQPAPLPSAL
ncbi:putative bifunctional diguanylate cyclase/phosphodiesterase [Kineococcus sp. SYSU DK004]|uniref:putative bifunctional diguanylate cyclase/phosphodiesterase n=1 Tax=Kineococcus sp. SYSU DK004 TaxID=3383125 RepID=UPI003D7CF63B